VLVLEYSHMQAQLLRWARSQQLVLQVQVRVHGQLVLLGQEVQQDAAP
jgi:hypothetical protein